MAPTVLVAWDPAAADRSAVRFALSLARPLEARVLVAGVVAAPDEIACAEGDDAPDPERALAELRAQLRDEPHVELRLVRAASAAAGLQSLIAEECPLLTVLGSAHAAAHGEARTGATSERVLHGAAAAVALVPRGHGERRAGPVAVGLLPTPEGLGALRLATAFARSSGARVQVLTILSRSPGREDARALAARLGSGTPDLLSAMSKAAGRDVAVDPQVLVGDPADALLRASAKARMLVLGSRAYGPPGVVLPGGAARQVLAGARCPVVLAPRA